MSSSIVEQIARAVLYEGYILYPYRPSALKNQQRWNFGVLYPPAWCANQTGSDRSYFQMECLAEYSENARVDLAVRFLQIVARHTGGREWQEGLEQNVSLESICVADLLNGNQEKTFQFRGESELNGRLEISAVKVSQGVLRFTVRVSNTSPVLTLVRNEALLHSLASAHSVLTIRDGQFISQLDPPEQLREAVAGCQNVGVWPVLVGEVGTRDTMLATPIILYDYPQVAPESKDDLFDATEIDEILILRILTLTDQEKDEVRRSDERARRILERLESSPPEQLLQLHGKIRSMQRQSEATNGGNAWSAWDTLENTPVTSAASTGGTELKKGDRVRLRPRKRADIFDTFLEGKIAVIEAVEEDFERNIHFAVVLEDDPGKDLGEMRQIGHRFFFSTEEVEPIPSDYSEIFDE